MVFSEKLLAHLAKRSQEAQKLAEKVEQNGEKMGGIMRRFDAPNLVMFSGAKKPPIPALSGDYGGGPGQEKTLVSIAVENEGAGLKCELKGISAKSSAAISRVLSSLDWKKNGQCLHVTATYWHEWPRTKEALQSEKSHIVALLGRHFEAGIWRLEYQARESDEEKAARVAAGVRRKKGQGGSVPVPHWHFLLWLGCRDLSQSLFWLASWWAKFSGNLNSNALHVSPGDGRAAWYLSMHAGKRNQAPPIASGRPWGYVNRDALLSAQDLNDLGEVTARQRIWWARIYSRRTGCKVRKGAGFSWYLPRAWACSVSSWVDSQIESENYKKSKGRNYLEPYQAKRLAHRLRCGLDPS